MNTRELVAVLALTAVSMLSACTPEEVVTSRTAGTVCLLATPIAQHATYEAEHQTFGVCTVMVEGEHRIVGYSATEDSSIWDLPECAVASAR